MTLLVKNLQSTTRALLRITKAYFLGFGTASSPHPSSDIIWVYLRQQFQRFCEGGVFGWWKTVVERVIQFSQPRPHVLRKIEAKTQEIPDCLFI
jgi:hypothetical protein